MQLLFLKRARSTYTHQIENAEKKLQQQIKSFTIHRVLCTQHSGKEEKKRSEIQRHEQQQILLIYICSYSCFQSTTLTAELLHLAFSENSMVLMVLTYYIV